MATKHAQGAFGTTFCGSLIPRPSLTAFFGCEKAVRESLGTRLILWYYMPTVTGTYCDY